MRRVLGNMVLLGFAFVAGCGSSSTPVVVTAARPATGKAAATATASLTTGAHGSQTFFFTNASQTFTVPPGVKQINADVVGASGASQGVMNCNGAIQTCFASGGLGEEVKAQLRVTRGETLYIFVGGSNGFNGGGPSNGPGGGGSDIRTSTATVTTPADDTRIVVAGGGGGAGGSDVANQSNGGNAGFSAGSPGSTPNSDGQPGSGGAQIAGGTGGSGSISGSSGSLFSGGNGGGSGGGGGGGYYGGGGGADSGQSSAGGGGGGSSFVRNLVASFESDNQATANQCDAQNNGCITLSWSKGN